MAHAWEQFIPFLEFHPAIRKVIYTTNMIESLNYQLRKITETRGHFPSTESAIKLLYLGIRNITGRHIDGEGRFAGKRGTGTYGWKAALNAFATRFGDRLPLWPRVTQRNQQHPTSGHKKAQSRPSYTENLPRSG